MSSSPSSYIPFGSYTYEIPYTQHTHEISYAEPTDFADQTARVIECSEAVFDTENFDFFNEYRGLMPLSSGNQVHPLEDWMPIHQPIFQVVQPLSFDPYPETPYPETPYPETPYPETPYPETPYPETPYLETPYSETLYPEFALPEITYPEILYPEIAYSNTYSINQSPAPSASIIPLTVITPLEQMVFVQEQADQSNFLGAGYINVENIPDYGNYLEVIESEQDKNSLSNPQIAQSDIRVGKWTAERDQTLWNLKYEQNLRWDQVCAAMNCSYISLKARYLALERQHSPLEKKSKRNEGFNQFLWAERDEKKLIELVKEGKDWAEIGNTLKRSPDSVRIRYQRTLGKDYRSINRQTNKSDSNLSGLLRKWTDEDIALLLQLKAEKKEWKVIADKLGRTIDAAKSFFSKNFKSAKDS